MSDDSNKLIREPIYRQVERLLREHLSTVKDRSRALPSELDLAREYGVSVITIRKAMEALVEEGIVVRYRGKGTFLSEREAAESRVAILCDLDLLHPLTSPFFALLIREVRRRLYYGQIEHRCYIGELSPSDRPEDLTCREFLRDLRKGRISGVISVGTSPELDWRRLVEERKLPLVGTAPGLTYAVRNNTLDAIRRGLLRLKEQGCRSISVIGWRGHRLENERIYRQIEGLFGELGLDYRPERMVRDLYPMAPGAAWEEFREVWLTKADKPDGLLLVDPELVRDVVQSASDCRVSIPGDLKLVALTYSGFQFHRADIDRIEFDTPLLAEELFRLFKLVSEGDLAGANRRMRAQEALRFHKDDYPERKLETSLRG